MHWTRFHPSCYIITNDSWFRKKTKVLPSIANLGISFEAIYKVVIVQIHFNDFQLSIWAIWIYLASLKEFRKTVGPTKWNKDSVKCTLFCAELFLIQLLTAFNAILKLGLHPSFDCHITRSSDFDEKIIYFLVSLSV